MTTLQGESEINDIMRILVIGNSGIGKSRLCSKICKTDSGLIECDQVIDYHCLKMNVNGESISFTLVDYPGGEQIADCLNTCVDINSISGIMICVSDSSQISAWDSIANKLLSDPTHAQDSSIKTPYKCIILVGNTERPPEIIKHGHPVYYANVEDSSSVTKLFDCVASDVVRSKKELVRARLTDPTLDHRLEDSSEELGPRGLLCSIWL